MTSTPTPTPHLVLLWRFRSPSSRATSVVQRISNAPLSDESCHCRVSSLGAKKVARTKDALCAGHECRAVEEAVAVIVAEEKWGDADVCSTASGRVQLDARQIITWIHLRGIPRLSNERPWSEFELYAILWPPKFSDFQKILRDPA